jgi:glycosyltransferase involved in cell wall biosynthesis
MSVIMALMKPLVSVLLPCFNAAKYLEPCLESLLAQSVEDFEVVAIDDGSEDETPELLERAAGNDRRIRPIRRPHQGLVKALGEAATEARAPLLARMDADDICHRRRLELQVAFLRDHGEVDVVASKIQMFPREELSDGLLRYESWVNGILSHEEICRDLFIESPLPHPSVMMRRESLRRVGGYRDAGWPEDYDLWMRMTVDGCRFSKLPETLLWWRDWTHRASRRDARYSDESFLALKEHYLLETYLAERSRVTLWGAGPIGKGWSQRLARHGVEIGRFVDVDPRKIGKYIHGSLVVAASEIGRYRDDFLLVAVGALSRERPKPCHGTGGDRWLPAREEIRGQLHEAGFVEGRDFICIA